METINHFIGGREVEGTSGRHGDVYNPALGELVRRVTFADEGELDAAVGVATQAFPAWAATPPLRRARVLFRLKGLIEQHMDEMAAVVTEEHGKTVDDAKGSITRGLEVVEFACGIPHLLKGEFSEDVGSGVDSHSVRQPLGVVAGITPFNFPAMIPEQEYFSDGLSEDLITALTHWRSFPVISRNSSFIYKGRSIDIKQASRELGARYLLEGSVRKSGSRVRITAQFIDGETGHHIWAERYDRELSNIFELQDEIVQRITAVLAPELVKAEVKRTTGKRPGDLDAWDCFLRGMAHLRERTGTANAEARVMFERAVEVLPDYADAHAGIAMSHNMDIDMQTTGDRSASAEAALAAARRAVASDEASSIAHGQLSTAYQWLDRYDDALNEVRAAVALNPNDAVVLHGLGNKSDLAGDPEGIARMEKAQKLNPQDSQSHEHLTLLARAYVNAGDFEAAVDRPRKGIQRRPDYPHAHYILAIALGHLGHVDEGRAALDTCEQRHPGFVAARRDWQPYQEPESNARLAEGLRALGGLPSDITIK